ncbi:MAG: hypothetical protein ACXADH_05330, partial [Candidatus Kariarchaeaceae archaeon]
LSFWLYRSTVAAVFPCSLHLTITRVAFHIHYTQIKLQPLKDLPILYDFLSSCSSTLEQVTITQ